MQQLTDKIKIQPATQADMELIEQLSRSFRLDTSNLKPEHLVVAKENGALLGFGRVKRHKEFTEIGTFAVQPQYRHKGIGHELMNHLMKLAGKEAYLITTIPEYGYRFGFRLVNEIPIYIQPHLDACNKATYPDKAFVLKRRSY